ncbi:MAG TPA: PQQ-binding-like beta-propeller repeat protein [Solirubrobacteraceae bacterium]|nr:PQQ-binding-like beta-propeller repeat protein [Solirubrobacteraceae bacterium]
MSRLRRVVLFGLPALALAACGGGSSSQSSNAAPATSTTAGQAPAQPAVAGSAWPTYHRDLARTGNDPTAPRVTRVRRAWSASVDGDVYAEPLVAAGRVVAATENDSLYAFDAVSGRRLWRTHLGSPVDGSSLPCGNINPSGITSTPAIDTKRRLVYAVAFIAPARHELAAVDLSSGRVRWRRAIDPPADPTVHQQRGALALANGRVYVPYGGLFGDCGNYHGWVVSVPTPGPGGAQANFMVPTHREGAIWAPSGPSVDNRGRLFVSTGNGDSTSSFDFGNTVIRLSPSLQRQSYFAPTNTASLNGSDTDLGSVGPLVLPGSRVFAIGKEGIAYLLDANNLGGIGHPLASRQICDSAYGGLAYAGGRVYVPCTNGVVAVGVGARSLSVAWRGPGFRAGPPIVAGGLVWTVDLDGGQLTGLTTGSGRVAFRAGVGSPAQFSTPSESGGRLYVSGGKRVLAFTGR